LVAATRIEPAERRTAMAVQTAKVARPYAQRQGGYPRRPGSDRFPLIGFP